MTEPKISASAETIRRLAVTKQHLAGKRPTRASSEEMVSLVRDLAYVQWDPISIVAPSHILSLWSRLGGFRPSDLDRLLWDEKKVFQHWTPIASLVLTEDYPLYYSLMKEYPESLSKSWRSQAAKAKRFLADHVELRKRILNELKKGPLRLDQFGDYLKTKRSADGWTSGSDVSNMLFHLHMRGEVMVVGHEGNLNVWGLSEGFLPKWVDRRALAAEEFETQAAQRAIRAMGTASAPEINYYFVRGRYRNLRETLSRLEEESVIHRVQVDELGVREERYVHERDVTLLESLRTNAWEPKVSLIAPFDNLIAGRGRTNTVFGFDYVHEQFLPQEKRRYGTYLMPILWGERLIGRVDPRLDKQTETLVVNSVHAEPGAPEEKIVSSKIAEKIAELAEFLGARETKYTSHVPSAWKSSLR